MRQIPIKKSTALTFSAGLQGGIAGGILIWIYEALVWSGVQHLLAISDIPRNATGLVFGRDVQMTLGGYAYLIGTFIHFFFAALWGILFAMIWPSLRRRKVEATLAALFYAMFAWIVMHVAIQIVSDFHPDYTDPTIILGGFVSHLFFTVPMALVVKEKLHSQE